MISIWKNETLRQRNSANFMTIDILNKMQLAHLFPLRTRNNCATSKFVFLQVLTRADTALERRSSSSQIISAFSAFSSFLLSDWSIDKFKLSPNNRMSLGYDPQPPSSNFFNQSDTQSHNSGVPLQNSTELISQISMSYVLEVPWDWN